MNIILAKTAGFCFGVNRAVNSVYDSIKKYTMPVYTYGQIIHNNQVVEDLKNKGVNVIDNPEQLNDLKEGVIIIRSHGVPEEIHNTLEAKDILSIDMTCPYVKKIHKIVKDHHNKGYKIIIIGDPEHPEVLGINGWCDNDAYIANTLEDCYEIPKFDKICMVVQTTFSREKFETIKNFIINNKCDEYEEFNTICNATSERQNEASEISKTVDAMIVIGGKHSSNTQKLFNICKTNCSNTFLIETTEELDMELMRNFKNIGITAGASTPKWIIEEVVNTLKDIDNKTSESTNETKAAAVAEEQKISDEEMDVFKNELDKTLIKINVGDIVKGEVVDINNEEITIDLGYKTEGVIPISELADHNPEDVLTQIKKGDNIEALVIKNSADGQLILSKKEVDIEKGWEKARNAFETKSVILVKVLKEVKGGVIGIFENIKVFIPISQLSDKYLSDINEYITNTVPAKIIEFNEENQKVVASSRIVLEESKKQARNSFWDSLHIGKEFKGKVNSITSYGAFVDIGGVDGLLHISEISWDKNDSADKHLSVDQQVDVFIKEYNEKNQKISLGLKNRSTNPWNTLQNKYQVDQIIEGEVKRMMPFGAFVELEPGIDGLVHISEISDKRINKPDEVLELGQNVKAKILGIDSNNKRISLSIKGVNPINQKGESNINDFVVEIPQQEDLRVSLFDLVNQKGKDKR